MINTQNLSFGSQGSIGMVLSQPISQYDSQRANEAAIGLLELGSQELGKYNLSSQSSAGSINSQGPLDTPDFGAALALGRMRSSYDEKPLQASYSRPYQLNVQPLYAPYPQYDYNQNYYQSDNAKMCSSDMSPSPVSPMSMDLPCSPPICSGRKIKKEWTEHALKDECCNEAVNLTIDKCKLFHDDEDVAQFDVPSKKSRSSKDNVSRPNILSPREKDKRIRTSSVSSSLYSDYSSSHSKFS